MSGKTNGAACGDDPAFSKPDKFASKIVVKMVRLAVAPPVDPLFFDLIDRPAAAIERFDPMRCVHAAICQVIDDTAQDRQRKDQRYLHKIQARHARSNRYNYFTDIS